MVFINEWLPYPYEDNTTAQLIELFNDGDESVRLDGWVLAKGNGKLFRLDGRQIAARGYLVLMRTETKLALKHSSESLLLYNASGQLVDQSSFNGSATKGKSFSRVGTSSLGASSGAVFDWAQHFAWSSPTPGAANVATIDISVSSARYPLGVSVNNFSLGALGAFEMAVALGVILAAFVIYFSRTDEKVSKLFFSRDDRIGG